MVVNLIRELSWQLLEETDANPVTVYLLEAVDEPVPPSSVARRGGNPIGISRENWPLFKNRPMEHLITLDLEAMPALKTDILVNARAVALFVSDRMDNQAFEPGTQETMIISLLQDDIDNGEPSFILRKNEEQASAYNIIPVLVPEAVFDNSGEYEEDHPLEKLKNAIFSKSYAAGRPLWLQREEHDGHFLFQFDESLIDLNLGDEGVMYVFTDTAFWQCL